MPNTLTASFTSNITGTLTAPAIELLATSSKLKAGKTVSFKTGDGVGEVNNVFADIRTITPSEPETLDLSGVLSSPFGETLAFSSIKGIYIENKSKDATLIVGGASANAWIGFFGAATERLRIPPGGYFELPNPTGDGWPVTAATADLLKIAHGGDGAAAIEYAIVLVGVAA
jgi:hypothetical protein